MPIKLPFGGRRESYPTDLWTRCPDCQEMIYNKQLDKNQRICPRCGHHFRLRVDARSGADPRPRQLPRARCRPRIGRHARRSSIRSRTPSAWPQPSWRPASVTRRCGGPARSAARKVAICVMDFAFMGGSMGTVVGEKVTRAAEHALAERLPLIIVSASGGARMQEGTLSLMQLAKTVRRPGPPGGCRRALHQRHDRPDDGRRVRVVCGAGRRQHRRAQVAHRLCRRARRGGHHRRGAARGLPARRVPVRARLRRHGRRPRAKLRETLLGPAALHARQRRTSAPTRRPATATAMRAIGRSPALLEDLINREPAHG